MDPSLHDYHRDLQAPSDELIHRSPVMKPHGPAIFPQIIGFNPIIKASESPQIRPVWQLHHDQVKPAVATTNENNYQQRMLWPSNRSPISPRSALQTLLAAARQINSAESNYTNDSTNLPLLGANCQQVAPSPICATQGLMQGLNGSQAYSKVVSKSAQSKEINHDYMKEREIKAAPKHIMMNDHVMNDRGAAASLVERQISSSLEEHGCRYLYLATSPLSTDFTPNMAPPINFLESCYLCKRPLGNGLDIFIYRGDTAFCSEECRYQKMVMDERKERYINTNSPSGNKLSHMQYAGQYNNHNRRSLVMPAA